MELFTCYPHSITKTIARIPPKTKEEEEEKHLQEIKSVFGSSLSTIYLANEIKDREVNAVCGFSVNEYMQTVVKLLAKSTENVGRHSGTPWVSQ
uniref:Uncharacterized protein n=1 Tax=Oryza meridionalis TaxID=40149 RepID=A0A0E0EMT8_9ORYZ